MSLVAVWRRSKAPPSQVVAGPLKSAIPGRPWCAAKGNSDWVHSVVAKVVLRWIVTACFETQLCHRGRLFASHLVESRTGAVRDLLAVARFPSPLIKPDVRIARIRLSEGLRCRLTEVDPTSSLTA